VTSAYGIGGATELPPFGSLDIGRLVGDSSGLIGGAAIVYDLIDAGREPVVIGPIGTRMAFAA
jgi:hypothetical protein